MSGIAHALEKGIGQNVPPTRKLGCTLTKPGSSAGPEKSMIQISSAHWIVLASAVALSLGLGALIGFRLRSQRRAGGRDDFFDQIRDAALITEHGVIIGANQTALDQFGYSRETFIGLPINRLLVHPEDEKRFVRALVRGPVTDFELQLQTSSSQVLDCAVTANGRFDALGNLIGCRGLARDVTDRTRILAELRRAENDYRGLFENAYDAILILDPADETVLDVNHRACVTYGRARRDFIGHSMVEFSVDPDRGKDLLRKTREESGRYSTFESRQFRGDGSIIDVEIHAAELLYKGRSVILSINRDVSARRRAEQAIRDSEARFRLLLESVTDYAIVMLDPEGRIVSWNVGAQRILGYTEQEVLGRSASIFAPPEEADSLAADLAAAAAHERLEHDVVRVRKDGSRFAATVTLTPMVDDTQSLRGFAVVTRDITEREQLEEARQQLVTVLRVVAQEWTETFDAVQAPIVLLQRDGEILRLNRAAQVLARRQFQQLVRTHVSQIEGQPWQTIATLAEQTLRHGTAFSERVTDGDAVWEVSSCPAGSGDERRAIVVAYDLTLVTRLEASLRQSEVAAALGTMVAAVAHEVRNPLFTISAIIDACGARYGDHEGVARYEAPLREQVQRLNRLMTDLLEYGKPTPLNVCAAPLGAAIRAAVGDCSVIAAQASVAIEVSIEPDLPPATIDHSRIEQVLQNLIDNALRHSPSGGTVRVEARIEDGGFVCRVIDEGPGIADEDLDRAFLPFFTRRRGGTGLGLAIARKIVIAHGGEIALARGESGTGTIATIRLPRHRHVPVLDVRAEAS